MHSFRLDERPWIPVVDADGIQREVSLLDAIQDAPKLTRIGGNPLEAAVLTRLLVAIAHLVRHPKGARDWARRCWNDQPGLLADMSDYVGARAEVWDLYDPDRPFLQDARIGEANGAPAALVYERARGNNPVFADHSLVADPRPLSSAHAARALLVTHAYGGSGTGGNSPINGGKKDTMYAGPLCARSISLLEGANLAETIALNVVNLNEEVPAGTPAWDRAPVTAPGLRRADGVADLLTRATRAVRLRSSDDGEWCVAAAIYMAEAIPADDEAGIRDPHIPRYWASADKKHKVLRLHPERDLWRSAPVLLAAREGEGGPDPAPVVRQIGAMAGIQVPREARIGLRFLGVAANAQGPVTEMWRDETLPFSLSVVEDDTRYARLAEAVNAADNEAQNLRRCLRRFAEAYLASGESTPDPKAVDRLVEELAPGLALYWGEIAPAGQRLGLNLPEMDTWREHLIKARKRAYEAAIGRLPANSRRLRAQFEHKPPKEAANRKGKVTS